MVKYIIASGRVIIENGKLLVNKDNKDDFYKIPGGTMENYDKSLEDTCTREMEEENNRLIKIIRPLHSMMLRKNPQTGEEMVILLIHYEAKLLNKNDLKPIAPIQEVIWLDIQEIKEEKYNVVPNISYLIEKGDIV